jgi:1-aminocyclopropane-1-carboxylate deaminase
MLGLMSMLRSGEIHRSSRILYVHLGGGPAVNAYCKAFDK